MTQNTITHRGTVVRTNRGTVDVLMHHQSVCGVCDANKLCGKEAGEERILNIVTIRGQIYREGEEVNVSVSKGMGIKAALIVFAYPFLLVFILLIILLQSGCSELCSALSGLGLLIGYYAVLYRLRGRIVREIQFEVSKITQDNQITLDDEEVKAR